MARPQCVTHPLFIWDQKKHKLGSFLVCCFLLLFDFSSTYGASFVDSKNYQFPRFPSLDAQYLAEFFFNLHI
jgi:Na+/alanine symporter